MLSTALALVLSAACAAANEPVVQPIVKGELASEVDRYMTRIEANGFSGSLLIAKGDGVILAKGYGYADRENRVPVTTRTVFDIGSITKQFTGAAIMKLSEEGKVDVNDAVTEHFDDVPERWRNVTIHHLLTHSAGFPDAIGRDYAVLSRDEHTAKAFVAKPRFDPGKRYEYSNVGYSLLGAIVEKQSGKSYETYLRENFFAPLGMNDTGYGIPVYDQGRLAVGYTGQKRWGSPREKKWADEGPYWNLRANGGILSTVWDMYKWHQALEGTDALSKESLKQYLAPHMNEGGGFSYYGYGWVVIPTARGTRIYTHNGGNGIFFADCYRNFGDDTFIMMLTNSVDTFPEEGAGILRILGGKKNELPDLNPPDWKKALDE